MKIRKILLTVLLIPSLLASAALGFDTTEPDDIAFPGSTKGEMYDSLNETKNEVWNTMQEDISDSCTSTQAVRTIAKDGTTVCLDVPTTAAVDANTAKATNATHTGDVTGSGALTIGADKILEGMLKSVNAATDEYCLTYETTTGDFEWQTCGSGSSVITDMTGTANRVLYIDGSGDVTELALGSDGTYLKSNGATSAPTFATPAGSGDVSKVGTPVDNQVGVWTGDGTIEGTTGLTYDGSDLDITGNITISGTVDGLDISAIDADDVADGSTYKQYNPAAVVITGGTADLTSVATDTITESGSGNGVTIESVVLEDGEISTGTVKNVKTYGAICDAEYRAGNGSSTGCSITNGTTTLTCVGATFTGADDEKLIRVYGAGSGGIVLSTSIDSITSTTVVELVDSAAATASYDNIIFYTQDDTSSIQAAIDAVEAFVYSNVYGVVELNNGLCYVSDTLDIQANGTSLAYQGKHGAWLLRDTDYGNTIELNKGGTSDTQLYYSNLKGFGVQQLFIPMTAGSHIYAHALSKSTISDVELVDGYNGMSFMGAANVNVTNIDITVGTLYPTGGSVANSYVSVLGGGSPLSQAANLHFNDGSWRSRDYLDGHVTTGLYIAGADGVWVDNQHIGTAKTNDVLIRATGSQQLGGVRFNNCWFDRSDSTAAIEISGTTTGYFGGINISDSVVSGGGVGSIGVQIGRTGEANTLVGLQIDNNNIMLNNDDGIRLYNGAINVSIKNNTLVDNDYGNSGADGIAVLEGADNFSIVGNDIGYRIDGTTSNQDYGISIATGSTDYIIANNNLNGNVSPLNDLSDSGLVYLNEAVDTITAAGKALMDDADAATQRATLALGNVTNVATDDTAYNATSWDANSDAATKNAIRDKIETMGGGSGDVVGPASSVDTAIARFSGTTGKLIQDYTSGAPTIGDTGIVTINGNINQYGQYIDLRGTTQNQLRFFGHGTDTNFPSMKFYDLEDSAFKADLTTTLSTGGILYSYDMNDEGGAFQLRSTGSNVNRLTLASTGLLRLSDNAGITTAARFDIAATAEDALHVTGDGTNDIAVFNDGTNDVAFIAADGALTAKPEELVDPDGRTFTALEINQMINNDGQSGDAIYNYPSLTGADAGASMIFWTTEELAADVDIFLKAPAGEKFILNNGTGSDAEYICLPGTAGQEKGSSLGCSVLTSDGSIDIFCKSPDGWIHDDDATDCDGV